MNVLASHLRIPYHLVTVVIAAIGLAIVGCSGLRKGTLASNLREVKKLERSNNPIKVYRTDGSIVLFRYGVTLTDSVIGGKAEVLYPDGTREDSVSTTIMSSEIAGATVYSLEITGGAVAAGTFTAVVGGVAWLTTLACLNNPKGCFGSCPTTYVRVADSMEMVAELFSTSISPSLARDDLDRLCVVDADAPVPIPITNEALETHYIDRLEFVLVGHDSSRQALTASNGRTRIVGQDVLPMTVTNERGEAINGLLTVADGVAWRSGAEQLRAADVQDPFDFVGLHVAAPGRDTVDIVLRWKNTLLSTVLLYDLVLRGQGMHALAWQNMLDTDPVYSSAFRSVYDRYSGIHVEVWDGSRWVAQEHVRDAGPIVWRYDVVTLHTYGQDTMKVRLRCLADNVLLDLVRPLTPVTQIGQAMVVPYSVTSTSATSRDSVMAALGSTDLRYLVHEPGSQTEFLVHVPQNVKHGTLFVRSNGYYYEWMRGAWMVGEPTVSPSMVLNSEQMIDALAQRWMEVHGAIEQEFYRSKIPLRKP